MSKECSIINDANGSESELYYKLIDALGSEKLAAEEYARVRGGFFKGTIDEPGVFGDWVAVQKLKDDPKNTQEIPYIGVVNPNGEPQLIHDRELDLHYYIDRNKDRHYINDRKFPLLRNEEIEEVAASLLFGFVNNNRKKDFNDFDEDTFLAKGEMISFIRGYVAAYKTKVLASEMTQEQKDEQIEAADLILDYEEDFKRAIIDKLEALGTKFRETVSNEVDEKSNDLQQTIRESYETSAKDSATANTKIMLSKIENVEESYDDDGNFLGLTSVPGDFLGLSTFVEFNEVWNTLQPALSDIVAHGHGQSYVDVLSQMKAELKKVAKVKPWAQKLATQLETMDQNKLNEFIQAFSKTKLNFYVTEVNGAEYKVINATSTTQADTQVSASWGLLFQTRHLDESGTLKEESRKEFILNKERLEAIEKEFSYSDKADPDVLSEAMSNASVDLLKVLHSQGVHEELLDRDGQYLERDGVTVDDLNQFIVLNGGVKNAAREFKRLIKAAKKTNEFILAQPAKGFLSKGEWVNPFTQETAMKHLANAFSQRQNNITDNAILANEGKSYYPYSNPMYLSSKINEWKREIKAKSSEDNSPSALDRLAMRPENENSTWLAYLRGIDKGITRSSAEQRAVSLQRLSKLDMGLANSFKSKGRNDGVGNTDIQYGDAINDHITKLLGGRISGGKSYFATITPADKGRRVELEGLPVFDTKTTLLTKEPFSIMVSSDTVDVAEGYFMDEYNRMRRVARENESLSEEEMIVHYHGKKGNGLKSQIFPELSHDSKNEEFEALRDSLYDNGVPIGDLNSTVLTAAQKKSLRKAITQSLQERIKETKEEIDQLTNVNSAIYKSYNIGGKKTRDQVNTAMAGDYFMNGLIATVEYSKMFSGDPAYYKNPADLIKRIPATYTDGLQLRLGTSDELKFNTATINAIEGKSKYYDKIYESVNDKKIADAYLGVNVTDAQAWITPNRWKFLKRRLGQWSKFHDKVYGKMMRGETLKPNEIKIAAQPLKGVYFDINQGRPVYLKYSQAVLVPSLVKNTPMQGLLDMMTKDKDGKPFINESGKGGQNEIHEVITLDGVKVGAVAPTTIHDENHNMLQGEKLKLNVVQLDNRGWKLQQDLPIKKIHETNVGSQIQKNILEGLDLDGSYGKNGEMSGEVLLQKIHDTVAGLSNAGKAELEEMFDIKDGKIQNEDKIYEELIQEFLSRGADNNVISALRKRTPFDAIPQIRGKVQSVLMSMFNKRLTKISTPGGSFIQVSPFGLETLRHEARKAKPSKKKPKVASATPGVFSLNEGQTTAKEEILDFLADDSSNTMSLVGYAGTGKTTLLKNIFDEHQKNNPFQDIIFSSPTHKANAVIKQKNPGYKIRTLHSLLGLRADMSLEEFDASDVKFDKKADSIQASVLVIDESSMINDELFELIKTSYPNTKILFVGDDAQIQPVGQDSNSKALSSTDKQSFLNEVMRAEDNEVLEESMTVRETKDFSYQNKSKSGIEFKNSSEEFLTDAFKMFTSEEFKNDPLHARILAASNKQVRDYNEKIHKAMFPEATDIFSEGAILMAYSNHAVDFRTKEPKIQNSGDYKVLEKGEPETIEVEGLQLSGFYITVQDLINPRKRSRLFSLDSNNDYKAIGAKHEEIRMAAIADRGGYRGWQRLAAFKDAFVPSENVTHNGRTLIKKTFEPGYAHTVHKSQGSTYQNVFVDETNIDNTFANKKELKAQLKYVAVTRAAKKAIILTKNEIENIPTPIVEEQVEEVETEETEEFEEIEIGTDLLSGIKIVSDNYDGNGLQPPRIDQVTGEVLRGQVFMPHSEIVKLLKDVDSGKDWMAMTGQEIMKYLTPEVLQLISYRIPNQGMSSNDALEIVGILPPEMGDSIIGYDGIPAKTGSDFDIDKMYIMTRNIEFRDGKVRVTEDAPGSKKQLQNQLIDLYEDILLDPKTYDKMMTSIDGAFLKEDIAGTKDNPDAGLFPAPEMANMETFSPVRQMKIKFEYLSGQTGVGKTAVHVVDHSANQSLNIRLNGYLGIGKFVQQKNGKKTMFDQGTDGANSIAESLSAFLNAYVDIAKDPYIARANHNDTTSPVTFMLLRAGVDLKWINRFIGQPILREAVEGARRYMSITSASGGMSESAALTRSFADVRKKYKLEISDQTPSEMVSELDVVAMEARIRNTDKPLGGENSQDANVLTAFEFLLANAKNFSESVAASRADTKGGRGSFVERKVAENKKLLVRQKGAILGFDSKFEGTALGTYHDNSVTWVGTVLTKSNLFWAGSKHFDKALDVASSSLKGTQILESADFGAKAENAASSYLMSGTELFSDINDNPRYLFQKLGEKIMELKETSDNFLIKELQVNKFGNKNFITIDNNNKPKIYKNKIYTHWLELYADPATKKLALDLVKYSFASTGFQSKLGSFFAHIPHEILRDEGVTRDVRKIGKEMELLQDDPNYISQMARHMAEDPSVVKRVSPDNTDLRFGVNVRNGAFVLDSDIGSPAFVTAMIDGEVALYRLHGFINNARADSELEGMPGSRDGVYIRTHRLGMKECKGGAVEYKYNENSKKSSFEANNLTPADKNAMATFLRNIKKDPSFKTVGAGQTAEKDVEINSEDQAKKVGNTKEAPKQATRSAADVEASAQMEMDFEKDSVSSPETNFEGSEETATFLSLDIIKANMAKIRKDNDITNNCNS